MKSFLNITLFVLFGLITSSLMGFIVYKHGHKTIHDIKVKISRTDNGGFIDKSQILNAIKEDKSIDTIHIIDFDISKLENNLGYNPYIAHIDAYININRDLIVNIEERETLLRLYLPDNSSFYIDCHGNLFPLNPSFTPRVIIANGYINIPRPVGNASVFDSVYVKTKLPDMYLLANKISANSFLKSQISQIYVNSKGEYDLIPELGSHTIKLGMLDNLDEKLRNLEAFYKKKLVKEGWEKYEIINLMYTNQIVCTKK